MLISVIVPVYNVEEYLHYAMSSLLNQTYKNFEVILVNDGSTDSSGQICDKYAKQYNNIFSYHKENGGLSDARNFGITKSKGEYITFLDPDDYLENYALELLIGIQQKNNVDIVSTRVKPTEEYNIYAEYKVEEDDFINVLLVDKNKFLEEAFYDKIATVSACGKLYRKEILKVQFPVDLIYEDLYIVSELALNTNKIAHTTIQVYNYYRRPGSIVNSRFSEKQYDFFKAIQHNRDIIEKYYSNSKKLKSALNAKEVTGGFSIIARAAITNMPSVIKMKSILSENFTDVVRNKNISLKFKVKYICFLLNPKIYYKLKSNIKRRG